MKFTGRKKKIVQDDKRLEEEGILALFFFSYSGVSASG